MLLNSDNNIITSSNSDFKLTVDLSNYYIRENDTVIFTVNGVRYPATVMDRITISVEFFVQLGAGTYRYDLAITRDGDKTITILDGEFIVKESLKNYLLGLVHRLYRGDSWLGNLFDSTGIALSEVGGYLDEVSDNQYFDTASATRLQYYEKEAAIILSGGQTDEERISQLMAKWRGSSKCTLETLQNVADSWRNATIEVEFKNGKIHIKFISPIGIPSDLPALKAALENVKPAHLAFEYTFLYKTWGAAKEAGTWNYHKANNWNLLRQNEVE